MNIETPPWTIVVDTREQLPYFTQPFIVPGHTYRKISPKTIRRTVKAGDYTLQGFETRFVIERKSVSDFIRSLTEGRGRFIRLMKKLALIKFSAILIEGEWSAVMAEAKRFDRDPVSIDDTIVALSQRYPRTHWVFRPTRELAEVTAWRAMHRYWTDHANHKEGK